MKSISRTGFIIMAAILLLVASVACWGVVPPTFDKCFIKQSAVTGYGLYVYRNLASTSTALPLAYFYQDHATDDQAALAVKQDAAAVPAVDIVGAIGIKHGFDAAAYWTATVADGGGVTFDSVSDGTASFTFPDVLNVGGNSTLLSVDVGGGFVTSSGSGLTVAATGALSTNGAIATESTVTSGKTSALQGGFVAYGGTSGSIAITPIASGTGATTIVNQAGTITVTLPSATSTLAGLGLANIWTANQELDAGFTVDDDAFAVADTTGVITLHGGGSIDNNTNLAVMNITEDTVRVTGALDVTGTIGSGTLNVPLIAAAVTDYDAQAATLTIAALRGGFVTQNSKTGTSTATTPTGTEISTGITGVAIGHSFSCVYYNRGDQTSTITAGASGVTVYGTAAITTTKTAVLYFICTAANTWSCYVVAGA